MSSTTPKVYKVRYTLSATDEDIPNAQYFTVIFVETDLSTGAGVIHHVVGNLREGMSYQSKVVSKPERSRSFHSRELIGVAVHPSDPYAFNRVCEAVRPPPIQRFYNSRTGKMEPMHPTGRFYAAGEARAPLVKWTEWVNQAISALRRAGFLRDISPSLPQSSWSSQQTQQVRINPQNAGGMMSPTRQQAQQPQQAPQQVQRSQNARDTRSSQTQQQAQEGASTSSPVWWDEANARWYTRLPNGTLSWI